jgi:hypothetical protein
MDGCSAAGRLESRAIKTVKICREQRNGRNGEQRHGRNGEEKKGRKREGGSHMAGHAGGVPADVLQHRRQLKCRHGPNQLSKVFALESRLGAARKGEEGRGDEGRGGKGREGEGREGKGREGE